MLLTFNKFKPMPSKCEYSTQPMPTPMFITFKECSDAPQKALGWKIISALL